MDTKIDRQMDRDSERKEDKKRQLERYTIYIFDSDLDLRMQLLII